MMHDGLPAAGRRPSALVVGLLLLAWLPGCAGSPGTARDTGANISRLAVAIEPLETVLSTQDTIGMRVTIRNDSDDR